MSQHTIEPWSHEETRVYFPNCLGGFDLRNCPNPEATARRISACVNACKGIGTESLERFCAERKPEKGFGLHREAAIEAQRDELLAALVRAEDFITNGIEFGFIIMPDADCPDPAHQVPGLVREAIAKAVQP